MSIVSILAKLEALASAVVGLAELLNLLCDTGERCIVAGSCWPSAAASTAAK